VVAAAPTEGVAPLEVKFDGAGSYDPDGQIIAYAWDFGDGATGAGAAAVTHQYAAAGPYTATLTVKDNDGATSKKDVAILAKEAEQRIIFVAAIDMTLAGGRGGMRAQAAVRIMDAGGAAVAGATVTGKWTGVVTGTSTGTTGPDGTATVVSKRTKTPGRYVFTVTNVLAKGCTYAPERNVETSDVIDSSGTSSASTAGAGSL
jgi:PKD repeat protein